MVNVGRYTIPRSYGWMIPDDVGIDADAPVIF